jgi:ABC-2 type transport system permease protein
MDTLQHLIGVLGATTKTYLRTHTIYTRHFMMNMFSYPIQLAAMYYIWKEVLGFEATSIFLPYYAVVFMLQGLQVFNAMVRVIGDMVTTGDIVLVLTRPFHLWQLLLGRSLARAIGTMALGTPVLGLIFYLAGVKVTWMAILAFLVTATIGYILEFLLFFSVGLTAFWTDRTWGQTLLAGWLVEVLGGRLVPLSVLPKWAQDVLSALPFAHIAYTPASVLLFPNQMGSLFVIIARQLFWLLVFTLTAVLLWHKGTKRYQGYGL